MKFAIDTNRYIDFCGNEPSVVSCFKSSEEIYVPFVVLGELRYGFLKGTRREHNEHNLVKFLNLPQVFVLAGDVQTSLFYAEIVDVLRKNGTPIPTNDVWIAALCVQHNLVLYTRDQHFAHIKTLAKM